MNKQPSKFTTKPWGRTSSPLNPPCFFLRTPSALSVSGSHSACHIWGESFFFMPGKCWLQGRWKLSVRGGKEADGQSAGTTAYVAWVAQCRDYLNQERGGEKMKCLKLQEAKFEIAFLVLYHFLRLFAHSVFWNNFSFCDKVISCENNMMTRLENDLYFILTSYECFFNGL